MASGRFLRCGADRLVAPGFRGQCGAVAARIDLDWEYPGQGIAGIKYRPEDKHNFTLLLQALRAMLDSQGAARKRTGGSRYLLTIAAADREYLEHTEMDQDHGYLDWINLMSSAE